MDGKRIGCRLFRFGREDDPLVVVNGFEEKPDGILSALSAIDVRPFSLLYVHGFSWEDDLTPYEAPSPFAKAKSYRGRGKEYLSFLEGSLIPETMKENGLAPSFIGIAGYSLAGLFALFAGIEGHSFARCASCSGSLWYPGFDDFLKKSSPGILSYAYLSLGDREDNSRNPVLARVREKTAEAEAILLEKGIEVDFLLNKGNHFQENDLRLARGIKSIVEK